MAPEATPLLAVTLVYAEAPRTVHVLDIQLPPGTTARGALQAAGWLARFAGIEGMAWAIWGRRCEPDATLREGDRLEVLRALRVDPKVARRERFVGQGARTAGLFTRRRPNSKSGY